MENNNYEKIALVTDSSSDMPKEMLEKYNIHTIPLKIIYNDREYDDGVDITPEEVYARFEQEVPKTSMPSQMDIIKMFDRLKEEGYKKILSIHLSCNLSGTVDLVRMISKQYDDLEIEVIDSKSVSIGVGMLVQEAARLIAQKLPMSEIKEALYKAKDKISVYYCIPVLDYLRRGGRIGLVAATLGTIMDLKPIISVNKEGKYYTYTKVRGRKKSLEKLVEIAMDIINEKKVYVNVYHGAAKEEALKIKEMLAHLPNVQEIFFGQISPAMVVHTGPGLVGMSFHEI
ncbi:MAG: degV family protein [Clostridia bacterium]|jgi:DegV family protein with EDD domain|nr:degV family protein [Clostridia bacterium]